MLKDPLPWELAIGYKIKDVGWSKDSSPEELPTEKPMEITGLDDREIPLE
jgi:hypothetical protein